MNSASNTNRYVIGAIVTCAVLAVGYYAKQKMNSISPDPFGLHSVDEITQKEASALFFTGNDYYQQGNFAQAIALFTKAIERNPNMAAAYSNRGLAFEKIGDLSSAHSDFVRTTQLEPTNAQAYFLAGRVLYKQQDFNGAANYFEQATSHAPHDATLSLAIEQIQTSVIP